MFVMLSNKYYVKMFEKHNIEVSISAWFLMQCL